jgi:hypothetical protein
VYEVSHLEELEGGEYKRVKAGGLLEPASLQIARKKFFFQSD